MGENFYWLVFKITGSVDAYLIYKNILLEEI